MFRWYHIGGSMLGKQKGIVVWESGVIRHLMGK